jgi:VWFA-related protein
VVITAVVVNDSEGHAVGALRAEDFAVYDKGKLQKIVSFEVEHMAGASSIVHTASGALSGTTPTETAARPAPRHVAYVFDDLQLSGETYIRLIQAARQHMATLRPGDKAAIFATSGNSMHVFTSNPAELQEALGRLTQARMDSNNGCPDLTFFDADLILNKHDHDAIMAAYYEMAVCNPDLVPKIDPNNPPFPGTGKDMAGSMIMASAKQIFAAGQRFSGSALQTMHDVAGYLSQVSGERVMVLASPGFLTLGESHEVDALIDIAVRNQVVINTLDARGLYTGGFSIKKHASIGASAKMNSFPYPAVKTGLVARGAGAQSGILASLAAATGGTFFESNNDLTEGFHQVSAPPEFMYRIGFSPEKLKLNGEFHPLKVELKNRPGLKIVAARKGYGDDSSK